jgi:hypothetical protein
MMWKVNHSIRDVTISEQEMVDLFFTPRMHPRIVSDFNGIYLE